MNVKHGKNWRVVTYKDGSQEWIFDEPPKGDDRPIAEAIREINRKQSPKE